MKLQYNHDNNNRKNNNNNNQAASCETSRNINSAMFLNCKNYNTSVSKCTKINKTKQVLGVFIEAVVTPKQSNIRPISKSIW